MDGVPARSIGPDLVFVLVLAAGLAVAPSWRNDPGSPWHLRLGRDILAAGAVPRADALTYTEGGTPWVDQSWLFDVALATVVGVGGWSLAVVLAAVGVALIYRGVAAGLEADGVSPVAAATATMLATAVGAVHFLVRPHVITLALVAWTLHACRSHHERGGRLLWTIPPLTVVWANCHGGFLAGPIVVATAAVGHAVSGPWDRARRGRVGELAAVLGLSCLATLVTPYGVDLHRHVVRLLLTCQVTDLIDEYQPAPFGRPQARVLEWVVLALVAVPSLTGRRIARYDLAHGLVWLHLALGSIRQAPLFALVIAPALGHLGDGALSASAGGRARPGRGGLWLPVGAAGLLAGAVFAGWDPARLDPASWPVAGLAALDAEPSHARLFHEQDWGGLIEAEARPTRLTFIDDRFELFGRRAILDYAAMLDGGPAWDEHARRLEIGLAWVRPSRGLARRLAADPAWRAAHRDGVSVLFVRSR